MEMDLGQLTANRKLQLDDVYYSENWTESENMCCIHPSAKRHENYVESLYGVNDMYVIVEKGVGN